MNSVAIVAIVALALFAFLYAGARREVVALTGPDESSHRTPAPVTEVILYIDPPLRVPLELSLPDRNPRR